MTLEPLAQCHVLVVDDQPSVRHVLTRMLRRLGLMVVHSASDGAEAIRVLRSADTPYDLVLCDLNMPNEDGLVLMRNLAGVRPQPAVILMSGGDSLVLDAARRLGEGHGLLVLGAMPKPVRIPALTALLQKLDARASHGVHTSGPALTPFDLDRGLREDRFEVWFQPLYHLGRQRVSGMEALVRLRDRELGVIGPSSFIGLAEQCGFIGRLTDYVLRQAASCSAAWRRDGMALDVSINVSAAMLDDLSLPDRIEAVSAESAVPPGSITLELTESCLADNPAILLDILTRIRLKGFRLSLDDFGTGYSSLGQLRELPFHELKLDRRFVQDAVTAARSRLILEGGFRLASELGMTTVAEGVDSPDALQMVTELGCDVVQGALLAMPMPAAAVPRWLRQFAANVRERQPASGLPPSARADAARASRIHAPRGGAPFGPSSATGASELADVVLRFAHDIASPLTVLTSLGEMLLEDTPADDPRRPDLELLRQAAREAVELVADVRRMTRERVP